MRQRRATAIKLNLLLGVIWLLAVLAYYGVHSKRPADNSSSSSSTASPVEKKSCSLLLEDGESASVDLEENVKHSTTPSCGGGYDDCSGVIDYTDEDSFSPDNAHPQQQQQHHDVASISAREQHYEHEEDEEERMKKLGLHKLVYDIGQGPETTYVYKKEEEDVDNPADDEGSTRSQSTSSPPPPLSLIDEVGEAHSRTVEESATLSVRLCKFFNLSNRTLHLILKHAGHAHGHIEQSTFELVKKNSPMMASAVACQLGQEFLFLDLTRPAEPVAEFVVVVPVAARDDSADDPGAFLFVHDDYAKPNDDDDAAAYAANDGLNFLPVPLLEQYVLFQKTLAFDQVYRNATAGRAYLSNIGPRARPVYPLWEARFVGQLHRVATIDAHEQETALTLNVVSTSPRIFQIRNFLSLSEVQHILTMAQAKGMQPSETSGQSQRAQQSSSSSSFSIKTRTSQTTWLSHHHSRMLQVVFQRAADVLQIPRHVFLSGTVTEDLQVLHYTENAEYKAHYDFGFPPIHYAQQPARFATLLIYLNDDMEGGETAFPRSVALHPEPTRRMARTTVATTTTRSSTKHVTTRILKQKPETGTAILFYSMLPDGNMDERSLHAALPVLRGEKYLCNLWVWDPVVDLVGLNQ